MDSYPRIGKVTAASVLKATGKNWDQWVALLEKAGARAWTHAEIVAYLKKRQGLGPWWQQGVTLGFEIAIGRRIEGRNLRGECMVTTTKSFAATSARVWRLLVSPQGQALWLQPLSPLEIRAGRAFETEDGYFGEIRTLKTGSRIRLTWQDPNWEKPTVLQVQLVARPQGKSILVFNHEKIRDARVQVRLRARWKQAVQALAEALAGTITMS